MHTDDLGLLQLPRQPAHHIAGIGAAHADGQHAQAAAVGRVAVGADHHAAGEGVVLQHHLVDDARAGLPETDSVLIADAFKELVHLVALVQGILQVLLGAHAGLDQVVAVYGAGHGHLFAPGGAELQQGHLRGGILHGHAVRREIHIFHRPLVLFGGRTFGKVGVEDLFGEGERTAQCLACRSHSCRIAVVHRLDHIDVENVCHVRSVS